MTPPAANVSHFSIALQSMDDEFRLMRITGTSRISGLFQYDIVAASKSPNIDLNSVLNSAVLVTVHGEQPRFIRGYINDARHISQGREFTEYRFRIVPWLWRLTLRANHRIFQDMTTNDILAQILGEHDISGDHFDDQTQTAAVRTYCVQYGESDYAFIARLMEEEGWHYHFQNSESTQILVLGDKNDAFQQKTGSETLRYEQDTSRPQDQECVHKLLSEHRITSGAIRISDFTFEKPNLNLNEITQGDFPALEQYRHHGRFTDPSAGATQAALALEQQQYQRWMLTMETHSTLCEHGRWLELTHHTNASLNQRYLIIESTLLGEQPQSLEAGASSRPTRCISRIRCIPWSTVFRAEHGFNKPRIAGPHSAIVTGPKGEEIYTDQYGRIKVQFPWDREGQADETTSCWLRANQPMAGMQWGGIALPRIGQEVIVAFELGDPDRPVMMGQVYNGQNMPAYALPTHKTRSGFKSLSTPGGEGYNELRIEDKKGSEQIFIRAEKDVDIRIKNTAKHQIDQNRHLNVNGQHMRQIHQDKHDTIGAEFNQDIGQNLSLTVSKDLHLKVTGAHIIDTGNAIHIKVGSKAVIQGGSSLSIKAGAGSITLDGTGVSIVGPLVRINEGGGGSSAQAASPTQPGTPAEAANDTPGAIALAATAATVPLPEAIDFDRTKAQLATLEQAHLFAAPLVEECDECALDTATASSSGKVQSNDSIDDSTVSTFSVTLENQSGQPLANKKFLLDTGGEQISGTTDASGNINVDLKESTAEGTISVWPSDQSDPISIPFSHTDELDDVSTVKGQQARLLNLGYDPGPVDGINGTKTKAAIKLFQTTNNLDSDGICGPKTQAALTQVYGR